MTPKLVATAIKKYEELDGGQGREVFFRPHRYRAPDLLPLVAQIVVTLGGVQRECALQDVSQNGVAFDWPSELAIAPGAALELLIRFDEHIAYRGEARVGSVREQNGTTIAGVQFVDLLLDMDDLLQLRSIKTWSHDVDSGSISTPAQAGWRVPGHDHVKALIAEMGLYMQDSEKQLAALEASLPWHVVHGDQSSPARTALIEQLKRSFVAELARAAEEIDHGMRAVPPAHLRALAAYSHRHLQHFFMQSPLMHRAAVKPFGYPGDYEVMRFIYERNFEGGTLFAKAVHLAFDQMCAPRAVRFRKDLVKRQLRTLIESRRGIGQPLRILSIAAGPAQELFELLHELPELEMPLEIVLFDQDKGALAYAYRRLKPVVDARFPKQVQVLYLHESIKRLLRDADLFASFGRFDAIYSAGLTDYLQATTAMVLVRNLVGRLAPGGKALIANMVPENPSRWVMEHHLDWYLVHRSRGELLELGKRAAPDLACQILEEESGINPFVEIAKR